MRHNKYTTLISVIILGSAIMTGCAYEPPFDPAKEALISAIIQATGADEDDVYVSKLVAVDSVTYAQEVQRRRYIFQYKRYDDNSRLAYYRDKHHRRGQDIYGAAVRKDDKIIAGLDSLKSSLGEKADQIAYYEYVYTAKAKTSDSIFYINDWHFIVTPRWRIIAMKASSVGIHRGLGKLVPGYMTILGNEEVSEEELDKYAKEME